MVHHIRYYEINGDAAHKHNQSVDGNRDNNVDDGMAIMVSTPVMIMMMNDDEEVEEEVDDGDGDNDTAAADDEDCDDDHNDVLIHEKVLFLSSSTISQ